MINILGLAFGLTCVLLISLWVWDELRHDQFHANNNHIYQLFAELKSDEEANIVPFSPSALASPLQDRLPEIQYISRSFAANVVFNNGHYKFKEQGLYTDAAFTSIFTFPMLEGKNQLNQPNTVLITQSLAKKYYPKESAIGKTISITQGKNSTADYVVTGVLQDVPKQSSIQFDFLMSYGEFEDAFRPWWQPGNSRGAYTNFNVSTYVSLFERADIKDVNQKLGKFISQFTGQDVKDGLFAYPFNRTYLYGDFSEGRQASGRIKYVQLMSIIAVVVLVIASINFINLSTATAGRRAKEVGLSKTVGALRYQLVIQFILESIFITLISTALALTLAHLILPLFNILTQKHIEMPFTSAPFVFTCLGVSIFVGMLAGTYPAFYLSAFAPSKTLKNALSPSAGLSLLRKGLVIFQFTLSIVFIVYTIVVYNQISFIQQKDLGIKKDNIVHHSLHSISDQPDAYRNDLLQIPDVKSVSFTEHNPLSISNGNRFVNWEGKPENAIVYFNVMQVDRNLLETFELKLIEGQNFPEKYQKEGEQYFIVNQSAARAINKSDLIGTEMVVWGKKGKVVGVVSDFNHQSITKAIEPLILLYNPKEIWQAFISVSGEHKAETLKQIEAVYSKYESQYAFDYSFVEDDYQAAYSEVNTTGKLNYIFATAAILIACIGLFGLSSYLTEQRTKETGIRKVLGASELSLIKLFSSDFLKLVGIAFIIAIPIAWYYSTQWLADFAYHIDLGIAPFAIAGVSAITIALITVSYITIKVAMRNPVKSLKYE
ncbi:ABC transporter permease [Fulvivirga maritima]|uniref:ABC transporter permease n=1 Tax=Fulvivirga maritima TaxID=2904247 RepID=UPI001F3BA4DC|nr:ABC transporter permease [Fulvivirga maritima]UII25056.1 ABC transporter permease [Fulvivirga maritima]